MDFQDFAEPDHHIITATFFQKKKLLHTRINGILSFLRKLASGAEIFIAASNLQKNSFTCK